jgi:2,4-dienoyl-CoA reductase (NADPH2)
MFETLFSPIQINRLEIKNRIAYPSLGLLFSYDGALNERYYNYFRERARGGAGIVTVGPVGIDFLGASGVPISLAHDECIPSFARLAHMMKDEGTSPWVQLFHAGAYQFSMLLGGEKAIAPSAVYSRFTKETPREMTIEDIKNVQEAYLRAAERAREAGFEGVEVLASAGYLITQFLSPVKNLREDEYGGSFENRVRFPKEIIEQMRGRLGEDFPIGIRMAGNDFIPGSTTDEEMPRIARIYEEAGVNIINVTGGWHESRVPQLPMELPRGVYSYLALNIKKAVSLPVIASNRITDPETADQLIRDGIADMVSLGRVLIADPEWPRKAQEGRVDEIRPCVACSQGCTDQLFGGQPVFCLANPRAGFEGERNIEAVKDPKRVIVIGAGPAGLEAAVVAANAGHRVEVYERDHDIGGQLRVAGRVPHKGEFLEFIRYYRAMLKKRGVNLYLNTEASIDLIREQKPDFVVVAEGAEPMHPDIEGMGDPSVISAWAVLRDDPGLGKRVAVIGGGAVGLETALFVARKGTISPETLHFLLTYEAESVERLRELMYTGSKEVTVFEMLPKVGTDVGKSTKWILLGHVQRYGIELITEARVVSINDGVVSYERDGKRESRIFDSVINASGARSVHKIADEMKNARIPYAVIGDAVEPRKIHDAIHEGFLAASQIS